MARIKPQALLQQSKKKKAPSRISVATIGVYILVIALMVFFLFSTYKHWSRRSTIQAEDELSMSEGGDKLDGQKKSDISRYAEIKTSKGIISVELYKDGSPEVVKAFIDACKKGHFKDMPFNLVIKNFVIGGSHVEKSGATEDWISGGKHYSHLHTSVKHEAFMLGTSKAKHDSGGFELFITTAPIPDLNEKVNVFGHVVKGEDIVQEIEEVDTDDHYRPKAPIRITEVVLKHRI